MKTRSRSSCRARIVQSVVCSTQEQGVAGLIPGSANFFSRIDDSHCKKIKSSLTAEHCCDDR